MAGLGATGKPRNNFNQLLRFWQAQSGGVAWAVNEMTSEEEMVYKCSEMEPQSGDSALVTELETLLPQDQGDQACHMRIGQITAAVVSKEMISPLIPEVINEWLTRDRHVHVTGDVAVNNERWAQSEGNSHNSQGIGTQIESNEKIVPLTEANPVAFEHLDIFVDHEQCTKTPQQSNSCLVEELHQEAMPLHENLDSATDLLIPENGSDTTTHASQRVPVQDAITEDVPTSQSDAVDTLSTETDTGESQDSEDTIATSPSLNTELNSPLMSEQEDSETVSGEEEEEETDEMEIMSSMTSIVDSVPESTHDVLVDEYREPTSRKRSHPQSRTLAADLARKHAATVSRRFNNTINKHKLILEKSLLEELFLKCQICRETFSSTNSNVPKMLPCHHTVCMSCLLTIFRHECIRQNINPEYHTDYNPMPWMGISCPMCRERTRLSLEDVKQLPSDRTVIGLIEVVRQSEASIDTHSSKSQQSVTEFICSTCGRVEHNEADTICKESMFTRKGVSRFCIQFLTYYVSCFVAIFIFFFLFPHVE